MLNRFAMTNASTLDSSEAGERLNLGMLASPLFPQERDTSANPFGIYHSNGESFATLAYRHRAIDSEKSKQQKIKSRLRCCASFSFRKKKRHCLNTNIPNFFKRKADQAVRGEDTARTRLSEAQSELDRQEFLDAL